MKPLSTQKSTWSYWLTNDVRIHTGTQWFLGACYYPTKFKAEQAAKKAMQLRGATFAKVVNEEYFSA